MRELYLTVFNVVFSGEFCHWRVDRWNPPRPWYAGRVIKDIYGQMCLPWVKDFFPAVKQVLVVRHPLAMAASRKRWQGLFRKVSHWDFLKHKAVYEGWLRPYKTIINQPHDYFAQQVVIWCILHHITFSQFDHQHTYLLFYEDLITNFEAEIRRLLAHLGDAQPNGRLDPRLLEQYQTASTTRWPRDAERAVTDPLIAWQHELSDAEIEQGNNIFQAFGLDTIYNGDSPLPKRDAVERILSYSAGA